MMSRRKKAKSAIVQGLLDVTKTAETMLGDSDSAEDVMEGTYREYSN